MPSLLYRCVCPCVALRVEYSQHLVHCSGLKLLCDDMETSTDKIDIERCETLSDVKSACRTAVEILNDLLCFDKLEEGVLEVHKHEVTVLPFIEECVQVLNHCCRTVSTAIAVAAIAIITSRLVVLASLLAFL